MGDYINPKNESKEDFLNREADEISQEELLSLPFHKMNKKVALCLVDNGYFSACVKVRNKQDAAYYADELNNDRPKRYFVLDRKKSKQKMFIIMARMRLARKMKELRRMFKWK